MRVCRVPFEPGAEIDWPPGKLREVVQVFHLDHEAVSVMAAKTLVAGALIRMVLPVVKTTEDAGWLGVAVGVVRAWAGIFESLARLPALPRWVAEILGKQY